MADFLVVAEDIVKTQTLSGRLGRVYAKFYQAFLSFKIRLTVLFCRHRLTLLVSDCFKVNGVTVFNYSRELSRKRLVRLKPIVWKTIDEISRAIPGRVQGVPLIKLWENKLAVKLMYEYLIYQELIERLLASKKFTGVVILDHSLQSRLVRKIAAKLKLKLIDYSRPNLNFINQWLYGYFRRRELINKLKRFKKLAATVRTSGKISPQPVLLGVDFHRHLKILTPLYSYLNSKKLNPFLVTDQQLTQFYFDKKQSDERSRISVPKSYLAGLFWPEVIPILKHGLELSRSYLTAANNLIKTVKPKSVVVTGDVRPIEISLSLLAKKYRIPSLTVSPRTVIFNEEPYRYNYTDQFALPGSYSRDQLIKLGVDPKKIHVCGDVYLDNISSRKISFLPSKKIVLLISFRPNAKIPLEEKRAFIELTQKAVSCISDAVLVIKPHPTEKRYRLLEELKQWHVKAVVTDNNKIELFDLLKAASVVVQTWSMTGLEAITFGRPVVIVNPFSKNYDKIIPYILGGGAVQARNQEELIEALENAKLTNQAKKFAGRYILPCDGRVIQRVVRLIKTS